MSQLSNPMNILKILDKSNCKKCNEPTCLAFAASVSRGKRRLEECPIIGDDVLQQFDKEPQGTTSADLDPEETLNGLKDQLRSIDFAATAERLGSEFKDDKVVLKVCGKDLAVDSSGNFYSEIHIHSWLTVPVLDYILKAEGMEPSGQWLPFRELEGGKDWHRFFEHRCEKTMKKVADSYPDFFSDMLHIFAGKQVKRHYDSDISLVLLPLPQFPILVCYWTPEDGMDSDMHLFFDATAQNNLSIGAIYILTTGLAIMFEKIALRHNA